MAARPRVVIVGAGFGGLAAAKRLEREPVDVVLIDQHNYHTFQPLLYQVATSGLNPADVAYAVRGLFRRQRRVLVRRDRVTGIDWDGRRVVLDGCDPIPFDYLIVAAGSSTNWFGIPGAAEHGFPLYSLDDAIGLRNHMLTLFEAADSAPELIGTGILNFVVVGGGPTGVEVAGAMAELIDKVLTDDFHDLDVHRARIVLVEQAPHLLGAFHRRSQRYARVSLEQRGVEVRTATAVRSVAADHVVLDAAGGRGESGGDGDGGHEVLATRTLIWAAGVRSNTLADALGANQGRGRRIVVHRDLSIPGHADAFAIGDVADIDDGKGGRLPQLAQVAMQGGDHAAEQILRTIDRRPRTPFHYFDKGAMATIGRRAAVAELPGGIRLTGAVAWLAWLVLHLVYLLGVRNRVSVIINWAWNYLTWDRGPRLILRAEPPPERVAPERPASGRPAADQPVT
jgi:NADH dehydrogenase